MTIAQLLAKAASVLRTPLTYTIHSGLPSCAYGDLKYWDKTVIMTSGM
jgi:hypothetical protein